MIMAPPGPLQAQHRHLVVTLSAYIRTTVYRHIYRQNRSKSCHSRNLHNKVSDQNFDILFFTVRIDQQKINLTKKGSEFFDATKVKTNRMNKICLCAKFGENRRFYFYLFCEYAHPTVGSSWVFVPVPTYILRIYRIYRQHR